MGANFVAREVGYQMTQGWDEGDAATQRCFRPEETFAERFDALLGEVDAAGFHAMDLWAAHLHPSWATEAQIRDARRLLDARGISVPSFAVWLPEDPRQIEKICRMAVALGCPILGGGCAPGVLTKHRGKLLELLEHFGLVFGYENHPEKSCGEILEKIGPYNARIGIALDTGWLGTQGADAAAAVRELAPRVVHVHLKDILPPEKGPGPTLRAMGHETCALGGGVVPVERCVRELKTAGYSGGFCIEHEPEDHNPMPKIAVSLERLNLWLNK